jgi:hypothetical protein
MTNGLKDIIRKRVLLIVEEVDPQKKKRIKEKSRTGVRPPDRDIERKTKPIKRLIRKIKST